VSKLCCLLVLTIAVAGCGEEVVKPEGSSDWMLGIFSNRNVRDSTNGIASVGHYEFREDGTLAEVAITHCEENREELLHEYEWSHAGDSLVIVDDPKPESDIDQWLVRPGEACNTLQVDEVQGGQAYPGFTLWRGAVCMKALPPCGEAIECPSCETVWCDELPLPCDE